MNEIADQITEEKISKIKKDISSFSRFKQDTSAEIDRINKRLEKIESTLHEMQMAILRKIGEYGENINNISKELKATQESFSKLANPIIDHQKRQKTESSQKETHHKGRPKKSHDDFEGYLR